MPRKDYMLQEKITLVDKFKSSGLSERKYCEQHKVTRSTLQKALRDFEPNKAAIQSRLSACRKRQRTCDLEQVDEALYRWFSIARANKFVITGPILARKAENFAAEFGNTEWRCSDGWLDRWKKRHDIVYKVRCQNQD